MTPNIDLCPVSHVLCHTHRDQLLFHLGSLVLHCKDVGNTKTLLLSPSCCSYKEKYLALDTFPADKLVWMHVWAEAT